MLLTLQPQYTGREFNDYTAIRTNNPTPRSSWSDSSGPDTACMESVAGKELPPPSTLVQPQPAMPAPLPPVPQLWQGTEAMQQWLVAKAEDDRRSQEEEKTRQESLRLEQRKVEHTILLESLRAGVPPPLVPFIFTGMNKTNPACTQSLIDAAQQLVSQSSRSVPASSSQPQQAFGEHTASTSTLPPLNVQSPPTQPSVGVHQRDMRTLATSMYTTQLPLMRAVDPTAHQPENRSSVSSLAAGLPTQAPRPMDMQQPQNGQRTSIGSAQHLVAPPNAQGAPIQQELRQSRRSSPSISFHHWVPPGSHLQTPTSTKDQPEVNPVSNQPHPPARTDVSSFYSPARKRKSQTAHTSNAPPATRSSEYVPRESRSSRNSPIMSQSHHQQPPQGAMPTPHETTTVQDRPVIHRLDSTEKLSPRMRRRRSTRSFKFERDSQSPEGYRPVQEKPSFPGQAPTSDPENISDPFQDTGDTAMPSKADGKAEHP
ncbi:hypothetical protein N7478_003701 [Penicillium angulare]|uniref:uncharacterized protein n=1 Tax=Penicillium angulare TaxID=116970 RepID=UPI002540F2D9|nr:uncharacterized protein N7478_003701 [Penicillium angulare]KAJ5288015.1 hypothetical protein N7478_003701 [Penicillium angulare]